MVRFAPINVPFVRRRQTASVAFWIALMPFCLMIFFAFLITPLFTPFALAYLVFIAIDPSPETGGRKFPFLRSLAFWRWFRDFFPIQLINTTELDPSKNYPLGFCSVSRRSIDNILSKGPGNSCMIVVGGAAEALNAFPYTNDLVVKKRLGFIKAALRNGASLVPVFSFGENDVWDQVPNPKGSTLRKFQNFFQKQASFSPPLFHGRGIINYDYGILPYRRAIISIAGAPIDCPKIPNPTESDLLEYQKMYLDGLQAVYDKYKDEYAPLRKKDLAFVE
ncbi:diacylglycerol O-acyltransferase 1 [Dinochytrium kinnereticum]|nr:diacylglycerol O-acyltransferase 1 [Dinochytrium kinnereticum]